MKTILALLISMTSVCEAQLSRPLQIQNNGTTSTPVRYNLNFVNSGCVDNALTLAKDCSLAPSSTPTFTAPVYINGDVVLPQLTVTATNANGVTFQVAAPPDAVNFGGDLSLFAGAASVTAGDPGGLVSLRGGVGFKGGLGGWVVATGGAGGASDGATVPGIGGTLQLAAGAAGANTSATGSTGGAVTLAGGRGSTVSGTGTTAGTGGAWTGNAGPGGNGSATVAAGAGGTTTLSGGGAGSAGAGGGNNGGNLVLRGGLKTGSGTNGTVSLGATNTSAISIGASGITTTIAGLTKVSRITESGGTSLVAGDFALSAGWGSTASIGSLRGSDGNWAGTISTAGITLGANPTLTLTFKDGTWTTAPVCVLDMSGTSDAANLATKITWVEAATTLTITFNGTPVVTNTYVFSAHCIGVN